MPGQHFITLFPRDAPHFSARPLDCERIARQFDLYSRKITTTKSVPIQQVLEPKAFNSS